MGSMKLLDAVIIIDFLNKVPAAVDFMFDIDARKTAISVVTLAEVLAGATDDETQHILHFIEHFQIFDINKKLSVSAALLRRQYRWKLPDAFQAAIAMEYKMSFITRNTKDFSPKKHSFVNIPYVL